MTDATLTEIRFWAQVIGDAKRTVMCNPDLESRIKTWVDARGMGGVITVAASPFVPAEQVFVIDEDAAGIKPLPPWQPTGECARGESCQNILCLVHSPRTP